MGRAGGAQSALGLHALPDELLARVLVHLPSIRDFGRADCVCRAWHARGSPVEQALRMRVMARGGAVPSASEGAASMTQTLCWLERLHATRGPSDVLAAGSSSSIAIDAQGQLRTPFAGSAWKCGGDEPRRQRGEVHKKLSATGE